MENRKYYLCDATGTDDLGAVESGGDEVWFQRLEHAWRVLSQTVSARPPARSASVIGVCYLSVSCSKRFSESRVLQAARDIVEEARHSKLPA